MPEPAVTSSFARDPIVRSLLGAFVERLHGQRIEVRSALDRGELGDAEAIVHQIKGSAGGFGFARLSDLAEVVETSCLAGDGPGARAAMEALDAFAERIVVDDGD